jgi:hypothetical protein
MYIQYWESRIEEGVRVTVIQLKVVKICDEYNAGGPHFLPVLYSYILYTFT